MAKILFVDDEKDVTLAFKIALESKRLQVDSYNDSFQALLNYTPGVYDLVVLDIRMPNMDGFALYQEIRKIDRKVKICFFTAAEMDLERKYREDYRFYKDLFLLKPISNEDLLKQITKIMNY